MSSAAYRRFLKLSDLAMLERILVKSGLAKTANNSGPVDEAARFLMRRFQEGMVREDDLTSALEAHLRVRHEWKGETLI